MMSESDEELPEFGDSVKQKRDIRLQSSLEILARRARETRLPHLLEEYAKKDDSVCSDADSEVDLKYVENFLKIGSEKPQISATHPGCDVLVPNLYCCYFNEESLSLSDFVPTGKMSKKLKTLVSLDRKKFLSYLVKGFIGVPSDTEYANTLCKFLLRLLSVVEDSTTARACSDAIRALRDSWQPNAKDFLEVFHNWGIPSRLLYSTDVPAKTHLISERVAAPAIPVYNAEKVLEVLLLNSHKVPLHSSQEGVYTLLRGLVLLALDVPLFHCCLLNVVCSSLSSLIQHMSEDWWNPIDISKLILSSTDHFHNLNFLCTIVLTTGERSRKLARIVAFAVIQKLLATLDDVKVENKNRERDNIFDWPGLSVDEEVASSEESGSPLPECVNSPSAESERTTDSLSDFESKVTAENTNIKNMKIPGKNSESSSESTSGSMQKKKQEEDTVEDTVNKCEDVELGVKASDIFVEDVSLRDITELIKKHENVNDMDTYSLYVFCRLLFHLITPDKVTKSSLEYLEYLIALFSNILSVVTSSLKSKDMPKLGEELARNLSVWIMICNSFYTLQYQTDD